MVLSVLGFLILGMYMMLTQAFTYKKAKNVARSAFVTREEEEEPLGEQPENQSGGQGGNLEIESNAQSENIQPA
jgi:hypothetical protein